MPATVFTAKVIGTMSIGLWAGYNVSLVHSPLGDSVATAVNRKSASAFNHWKQLVLNILNQYVRQAKPDQGGDDESAAPHEASEETTRSSFSPRRVLDYTSRAFRVSILSGIASIANFVAYSAASRSGKHPYLLYLALGAPLVGILQLYGSRELRAQADAKPTVVSLNSDESEEFDEVNHSEVAGGLGASTYHNVKAESSSPAKERASSKPAFTLEHKYSILSTVVGGLSAFLYAISVIGLAGDTMRF